MVKSKCFVCAGTASNSYSIVHKFKNLFLNKLLPFYHEGHEGQEGEFNPLIDGPNALNLSEKVLIGKNPPWIFLSYNEVKKKAQIKECRLWSAPAQFLTRSLSIPRSMLNLMPGDKCSAWGYVHNCRLYANPMRCLLFHIFNRHKVHGMQRSPVRRTIEING